jgi:hypothetical protein
MEPLRTAIAAVLGAIGFAAVAEAQVTVHTAYGGFILGYDVDRAGAEGLLCEAVTLPNGKHDVAVETFDQRTGNIVRVVRHVLDTNSDFVALGIAGNRVGLVEYEHVSSLYVDRRQYFVMNPLDANAFTGTWNPPLTASDILQGVSESQGFLVTAFLGFHNGGNFDTFVLSSNVGANTHGPVLDVTDPLFSFSNSPVIALDSSVNQAVLAASTGCPQCRCRLAQIDLASGSTSTFDGAGFGYVNGIAVDSATRVACTTTEIDFSVEFYDLVHQTGFAVTLPGATSQLQSGRAVALDPAHRLFLVGQEFSSTAPSGSSIQVYDEQGTFVESINGLSLPASPVRLAIRPRTRTGFVLVAPSLTALQSFSY